MKNTQNAGKCFWKALPRENVCLCVGVHASLLPRTQASRGLLVSRPGALVPPPSALWPLLLADGKETRVSLCHVVLQN